MINKTGLGFSIVSQPSPLTLNLVGTNPNSTPPAGANYSSTRAVGNNPNSTPPAGANSSSNNHAGSSSADGTPGFVVSENSPIRIAFSPPHSHGSGFGSSSGSDSGSESPTSSANRNFSLN